MPTTRRWRCARDRAAGRPTRASRSPGWPTASARPRRISPTSHLIGPLIGHVGDGNFHLVMPVNPDSPEDLAEAERLTERLVERTLAMDGTCSGEHGVGLGKMRFLEAEHGRAALDVMRTIKQALDPLNLMNPGKDPAGGRRLEVGDRDRRSADRTMRAKRPLREPVREAPGPKLKNYITPAGLQRLKDEHRFLLNRERPAVTQVVTWAASNGDRSENADYQYGKRRLRQIDSRIRFLSKRIDAAEVVDPAVPRAAIRGDARLLRGHRHLQRRRRPRTGREHRRHRRSRSEPPLHQLDLAAGARADEVVAGRPRRRARTDEDRTDRDPRRRVRRDSDGPVPRTARRRIGDESRPGVRKPEATERSRPPPFPVPRPPTPRSPMQ